MERCYGDINDKLNKNIVGTSFEHMRKIFVIYEYDLRKFVLTLDNTIPTFNHPETESFENIVGKGENAGNQHFLLFLQCFLPISN